MVKRTLDEAARAMGGEVIGAARAAEWSGAALDSRRVNGDELFFALRGAQADGHRFVDQALAAGAAAAVVDDLSALHGGERLIRVTDAYEGLHALTRTMRDEIGCRIVGISGSVGKTTCKELLAGMMDHRYRVAASPGNLNNLYGFPLALLGVPDGIEWMVAEMGMSQPGELAGVSRLARPDVAVLTNVRPVHLEFFGSLRKIAEAKAGLLAGLSPSGLLVANADDPEVAWIVEGHNGAALHYGFGNDVDVRADRIEALGDGRPGSSFHLHAGGESQRIELPLHGGYNVENCLAAAACAWALGVSLEEIAAAAAVARPAPMRGVVHQLVDGVTVIDDAYNSSPDALERALAAAATLPASRRWVVLGEMLELGPAAPTLHREAGRAVARHGFAEIFGVGELAVELVNAARSAGVEGRVFDSAADAAALAVHHVQPGDLVLIKGSRGVGLERVVDALLGRGAEN